MSHIIAGRVMPGWANKTCFKEFKANLEKSSNAKVAIREEKGL